MCGLTAKPPLWGRSPHAAAECIALPSSYTHHHHHHCSCRHHHHIITRPRPTFRWLGFLMLGGIDFTRRTTNSRIALRLQRLAWMGGYFSIKPLMIYHTCLYSFIPVIDIIITILIQIIKVRLCMRGHPPKIYGSHARLHSWYLYKSILISESQVSQVFSLKLQISWYIY